MPDDEDEKSGSSETDREGEPTPALPAADPRGEEEDERDDEKSERQESKREVHPGLIGAGAWPVDQSEPGPVLTPGGIAAD